MARLALERGYRVMEDGSVTGPNGPRAVDSYSTTGYRCFSLKREGVQRLVLVHKLAALQWFGDAAMRSGVEVRHLNGDRTDNARVNIAMGSRRDNARDIAPLVHARTMATARKAQQKIRAGDIAVAAMLRANGETWPAIGRRLGVHEATVRIAYRKAG